MSVKRPVSEFVANQLAPSDLISVMYPLTPTDAVTLTRSHQGVINTVDRFVGRKYDYEPINDVERGYVHRLTPQAIEMIRRQVSLTAMRGICTKLGSMREGRKSLILISEGYTSLLPPQLRSDLPGVDGQAWRPDARSVCRGEQPDGGPRAVLCRHGPVAGIAGRVRCLQPQQHVDLRAGSARPERGRVRCQHQHLDPDQPAVL